MESVSNWLVPVTGNGRKPRWARCHGNRKSTRKRLAPSDCPHDKDTAVTLELFQSEPDTVSGCGRGDAVKSILLPPVLVNAETNTVWIASLRCGAQHRPETRFSLLSSCSCLQDITTQAGNGIFSLCTGYHNTGRKHGLVCFHLAPVYRISQHRPEKRFVVVVVVVVCFVFIF